MGTSDIVTNTYLKKAERSADLINCYVCNGKQLVRAEDVRLMENVHYRVTEEGTTRVTGKKNRRDKRRQNRKLRLSGVNVDLVEEARFGMRVAIISLENQSKVHYAMPIRMLNEEAVMYHEQWREIAAEHEKRKDLSGAEYMSGMAKGETVRPVILLVVYWGKEEWNGPRNLRDMIDWEGYPEEIRNMITDYPLHLVEVRKEGVGESFKSDLREVFGFLQRAEDRERLRTYVEENREAFQHMATDACRTLEVMGNVEIINHDHEDKEDGKEVTHDVCKAIEDMKEESRLEGRLEGRLEESNQKICIYVTMLMKNLNLTEEKACQALEITPEDYRAACAAVMAHKE
ncbi:MAG: Rpn family recombination-promoting nuclease/putative transposase [Lachnospiraceae bacterium]|nr:Rpn family recombination-promoting nuclease/putative transposase [Lachnospiraceae bacterium]